MSRGRRYAVSRIHHMLEACRRISDYVARGRDEFERDPTLRDALMYQLIVVGEAAKAVVAADGSIQQDIPAVEWSAWAKLRDFLSHQYWRTQRAVIWTTASQDVPGLAANLRAALASIEDDAADGC